MNTFSPQFAAFFTAALAAFWLTRGRGAHLPAVLACSLVFYACTGWMGIAVLSATAVAAWLGGRAVASASGASRARITAWSVAFCLLLLGVFKYTGFAFESAQSLAVALGLSRDGFGDTPDIAYIAGISFFTFQAVSYLVDVKRGTIQKPLTLLQTAAYISFFPTIMAGPIMRASDFAAQAAASRADFADMRSGFVWIASGLFKKVVVASYLSEYAVRSVFASPEGFSSAAVLLGVYAYAIQIYCDFSGYTDIAVGLGRLLGYRIPDNFASPYLALSVQDFWRRWHITLSTWLRDYLYISLGGNRRGNTHVNLFATMLLGGLWHGAAWTFVVWGGAHGLALVIHRLWARSQNAAVAAIRASALWKPVAWFLALHSVCLLWIFFRADSMDSALSVIARIAALTGEGEGLPALVPAVVALGMALQFAQPLFAWCCRMQARMHWALDALAMAAAATAIMALGPEGILPFIYFGF